MDRRAALTERRDKGTASDERTNLANFHRGNVRRHVLGAANPFARDGTGNRREQTNDDDDHEELDEGEAPSSPYSLAPELPQLSLLPEAAGCALN